MYSKISLGFLVCAILSLTLVLYFAFKPNSQPDGVEEALFVVVFSLGGIMAWTASVVLAIIGLSKKESKSIWVTTGCAMFLLAVIAILSRT